jgi:hypothetical protein
MMTMTEKTSSAFLLIFASRVFIIYLMTVITWLNLLVLFDLSLVVIESIVLV